MLPTSACVDDMNMGQITDDSGEKRAEDKEKELWAQADEGQNAHMSARKRQTAWRTSAPKLLCARQCTSAYGKFKSCLFL